MRESERRKAIEKLNETWNILNNEEISIYADYATEFGNGDNWDEEIIKQYDEKVEPIQKAMNNIWKIKKDLENKNI